MILPSAWDVVIFTDSESVIKAYHACSDSDSVYKSSQWHLLRLLQRINKQRLHPVTLEHVRSHQHLMTPDSVGNGVADFVAEQTRIFGAPVIGVPQDLDIRLLLPPSFLTLEGSPIISFKEVRAHARNCFRARLAQWSSSRSQAQALADAYQPEKSLEVIKHSLKGAHLGTLTDCLTRNITRPDYRDPERPVLCLFCVHYRRVHCSPPSIFSSVLVTANKPRVGSKQLFTRPLVIGSQIGLRFASPSRIPYFRLPSRWFGFCVTRFFLLVSWLLKR